MSAKSWTDEQLISAVKSNISIRGILQSLNLKAAGGNYKVIHHHIKRLNLNIDHLKGKSHLSGKVSNRGFKRTLDEILTIDSYCQSHKLKIRLIKMGLLINNCYSCGITTWLNKQLSLHLDHINGINTDNRIENLQLLCPNCHSLTDTFAGKNKGKH